MLLPATAFLILVYADLTLLLPAGMMVFADRRYQRHDKRDKLPGWITRHLKEAHLNLSTDMLMHVARHFMRAMAQNYDAGRWAVAQDYDAGRWAVAQDCGAGRWAVAQDCGAVGLAVAHRWRW